MFFVQIPINRPRITRMPRIISRAALWSAATWRLFLMTLRLAWFVTALRRYIGSSQTICPTLCVLSEELNPCHPCPSVLIRGWTSTFVRTKPLEFFCQPVKFDCPITAKSCAAIVVRQAQRLRRLGRAAAARSTGLRPVHFIHFIEAAINRGPNLPEGIRNHYNSVMIGKQKILLRKSQSLCAF